VLAPNFLAKTAGIVQPDEVWNFSVSDGATDPNMVPPRNSLSRATNRA